MNRPIARAPFEAFDADQVSLPCETCGLNEYVCECEVEVACQCGDPLDANGYCAACEETWSLVEVEPKQLGDGWHRVAA